MRYLMIPICLMMSVLLTGSAWAEDEAQSNEGRAGRRAEMRQKMLEKFDADGDGELNDEERTAAREEMRSRRGDRANNDKAKAGKGRGGKAKGNRGSRRDGQGRRGGPGGPPDPGKLFDKFDANDDGQLSRAEFMKLSAEMRSQRRPRVADNRGGPRRDGSRQDGPPPEGRRRFERDQPLQNPDDRPGPPPRAEGRRRLLDEDAPAARGRKGRGSQGPGARGGAGGRGRPNPGYCPTSVLLGIFYRVDDRCHYFPSRKYQNHSEKKIKWPDQVQVPRGFVLFAHSKQPFPTTA